MVEAKDKGDMNVVKVDRLSNSVESILILGTSLKVRQTEELLGDDVEIMPLKVHKTVRAVSSESGYEVVPCKLAQTSQDCFNELKLVDGQTDLEEKKDESQEQE